MFVNSGHGGLASYEWSVEAQVPSPTLAETPEGWSLGVWLEVTAQWLCPFLESLQFIQEDWEGLGSSERSESQDFP